MVCGFGARRQFLQLAGAVFGLLRVRVLDLQQQMSAAEWMKNRDFQVKLQIEDDSIKKQMLQFRHDLQAQGITDPIKLKVILDTAESDAKAQAKSEKLHGLADQSTGIWEGAFQKVQTEGLGGFVSSVLGGIGEMLNQMASKILAQQVVMGFLKAFGIDSSGGLGNKASAPTASAGGGLLQSFIGPISQGLFGGNNMGSAFGLHGKHANGLNVVPFDGYRAMLHKNEAVLNASDAHAWRGMQAGVATSVAAPQSSTRHSSNTTVSNSFSNIILPNVREPQDFAPALGQAVSRRSAQNQAHDFVAPGGRGR